ncbi:MAG: hypothetical protein WC738_01985 [Candidatus Omnitrophota bacterium]|jgi:hypothetical protein
MSTRKTARAASVGLAVLFVVAVLFPAGHIFAKENSTVGNRIGPAFKALAKAFVARADVDKLKRINIDKLDKMSEEKFKREYAEAYRIIKYLPFYLRTTYKVSDTMTKWQAIRDIKSLDKKKLCEVIDSIPNTIIAREFEQYLNKERQNMRRGNIVAQINKCFNRAVAELSSPSV